MIKKTTNDYIQITTWEIASWAICTVVFSLWNWVATKDINPDTMVFFAVLSFFCWLSGRLITSIFAKVFDGITDFNLFFLVGFFFFNTAIYLLYLILPFTVTTDFILVSFVVVIAAIVTYRVSQIRIVGLFNHQSGLPSFLALLLILIATSFWAQSSLNSIIDHGNIKIYRPWVDSFFHAQRIAAFAASHGFSSLNNIFLSGQPASLYHYASYIMPSELNALTATSAYQSFTSFLTPFGLLLSGLAAFVLVRYIFGAWAGFAACVALFIVPDPYQLGMGNPFLSYHWLQQIGPANSYGIAIMAIAWLFMLDGCKRGSWVKVAIAYVIWGITVNYKAHVFFANALPIVVYPAIFFSRFSKWTKFWWLFSSLILFGLAMKLTEHVSFMPLIKLNGSSFQEYTTLLISMFDNGALRNFFSYHPATPFHVINQLWRVALTSTMLFACAFGVIGLLYFIAIWRYWKKIDAGLLFFPLIIIVNYLVMSLGLAYDSHGIGTPEELLHRPFVWAYFVVIAWTGGALYFRFKDSLKWSGKVRILIIGALLLSLVFPFWLGRHIQRGPWWGKNYTDNVVPAGLVDVCDFIRTHSEKNDIVQDSQNDKKIIAMALSERHGYVIDYFTKLTQEQRDRLSSMAAVKKIVATKAILNFFITRNIKWFILHPEDKVFWNKDFINHYVYESHGYRVYFF